MKKAITRQALLDYGSFLLYFIPCVLVVGFTNIILVPRFEKLMQESALEDGLPPILSSLITGFRFFFDHFSFVIPPLVLIFVFAELYSKHWRDSRRIVFDTVKFIFVFSTMSSLLILVTTALALLPTTPASHEASAEQNAAEQPTSRRVVTNK